VIETERTFLISETIATGQPAEAHVEVGLAMARRSVLASGAVQDHAVVMFLAWTIRPPIAAPSGQRPCGRPTGGFCVIFGVGEGIRVGASPPSLEARGVGSFSDLAELQFAGRRRPEFA
jgi:hypothetical protein